MPDPAILKLIPLRVTDEKFMSVNALTATEAMSALARLKPVGVTKLKVRVNAQGAGRVHETVSSPYTQLGSVFTKIIAALALEANNDAAVTTDVHNRFLRMETSFGYGSSLAIVTGAIVNNTLVTCDEPSCSRTFCGRSKFFMPSKTLLPTLKIRKKSILFQ